MSSLRVTDLVKYFDDVRAVDGLNLDVQNGEFFALLGPSASGKTTTFRTICGIESPTSGTIEIDGRDVTNAAMRDRDVTMVFQTFALYPHLTVRDNLAYPLRQQKLAASEVNRRIDEIAELLRLAHTLDRKPGTASGGEQQRIAIGRALIRQPHLLLLDEPLTNLDAKLRHDTRAEFKRIHRERQITIVYATPDELEALTMGERIGVLRDGRIAQTGTPDELYDRPDSSYVAGMVGSPQMNLIDAKRGGDDNQPSVVTGFGEFREAPWRNPLTEFSVGEELIFGIRPHEIKPVTKSLADGGSTFDCKVHLTEPIGDLVILDLIANGNRLKMVLPEEQAIGYPPGASLTCGFDLDTTHVFAKETGTVIRQPVQEKHKPKL
ncbi:ABC transporter ATP-binding protein [Labrenzia sp. PHM005]|uniref:ABC transporter ATP-binding protein n=1 Tax=Labrenzia sp. PHM005 TaxID=2590016 RepID=UPI00113FCBF9|nr:ABC transporter ATP-binding protein [Labrenzia sp. PHM005]QDG78169.1 ABC transporter ATP-binding protein [Labrenzia sp. PHM005]